MATAGDQIKYALRLIGQLAEGEEPSAAAMGDAVTAFNQMLDSWSIERLSVFCTIDNTVTWPSGESTRTAIGELALSTCPIEILDSTYYVVSGISYPIALVNEDQYNAITLKSSQSTLPQVLYCERVPAVNPGDVDDIRMKMWPVPTQDIELHLISVSPLNQITSESDDLVYPRGYLRAIAYNLAVELAPQWGVEPSRTVKGIAATSKRNLKRINNPGDLMSMPIELIGPQRYNIYTGWQQ